MTMTRHPTKLYKHDECGVVASFGESAEGSMSMSHSNKLHNGNTNQPMLGAMMVMDPSFDLIGLKENRRATPPEVISRESNPLDLSVTTKAIRVTQYSPEEKAKPKMSPAAAKHSAPIDKAVLIGLLQTALRILTTDDDAAGTAHKESHLSRKSTSLLFAIGTFLIALAENDPITGDIENEKKGPPIGDCHLQSVSTESSQVAQHSTHTGPSVLPPAPAVAVTGSALDWPQMPRSDNTSPTVHQHTEIPSICQHAAWSASVSVGEPLKFTDALSNGSGQYQQLRSFQTLQHDQDNYSRVRAGVNNASMIHCQQEQEKLKKLHRKSEPLNVLHSRYETHDRASSGGRTSMRFAHNIKTSSVAVNSKNNESSSSECIIVCPVCKFDARWFSELRAHMVNHSDHRMFGCCYCSYRAKWKWDVAKHIRRCPFGRHVAHLSNEALLRMVKYHPPPVGNILFNYFPQDGFPGVGLDRAPTPPNCQMEDSSKPNDTRCNTHVDHSSPKNHLEIDLPQTNPPVLNLPPNLSRHNSVSENQELAMDSAADCDQEDEPSDLSPAGLTIDHSDAATDVTTACKETNDKLELIKLEDKMFTSEEPASEQMALQQVEVGSF